ncbi:NAD(P)H-binding protein [Asanoa sp. NPDC049573]|uniref:NAD(P)H-binding protein n=1 Tax=Asanoa sp. NPDC049573 TaxID=3155396 RepID=UPI003418A4B3
MTDTILVTGGTGNIGRHLVDLLRAAGADHRVLARRPGAAALLPPGTEVVSGDLTDPGGLVTALAGVDRVFLLWPFLTSDGIEGVAKAMADAGVRLVVYVSSLNVTDDNRRTAGVWGEVEQAIIDAGLGYTFLRGGGFATNTLTWAPAIRRGETVRLPSPLARRSLVHEADLAEVAAAALTGDHAGRSYVLTGPAALSQADQLAAIGAVLGRPVEFAEQHRAEARAEMLTWGNAAFVDHALDYWESLVDRPEPVTNAVREILGRPARDFRTWAADHADDFRTLPPAEVADRYVGAFRAGRMDQALRLAAPDLVRVAPLEGADRHGLDEIMAHSRQLTDDLEIHGVTVDGPFAGPGGFGVRFAFDQTHRPTGARHTATKFSLYTVTDGAIVREEVFHLDRL